MAAPLLTDPAQVVTWARAFRDWVITNGGGGGDVTAAELAALQAQVDGLSDFGWHKVTKGYADFSIADTEKTIDVLTAAADTLVIVRGVAMRNPTVFAAPGDPVVTINTSAPALELVASDPTNTVADANQRILLAAESLTATALNYSGYLDDLTAGSVDIWILYSILAV